MYESSCSHFFRTTTGIQSGPNAFNKSKLVMTLLINLAVTEILCCFRLVLEGKAGKEIPEPLRWEFLGKVFRKKITLSDAENNTLGLLNGGVIEDLPALRHY